MKNFLAKVTVQKIETVADPEGKTIFEALKRLGYKKAKKVKTGKVFFVKIEAENEQTAEELVETISKNILSNPIIEEFCFELKEL